MTMMKKISAMAMATAMAATMAVGTAMSVSAAEVPAYAVTASVNDVVNYTNAAFYTMSGKEAPMGMSTACIESVSTDENGNVTVALKEGHVSAGSWELMSVTIDECKLNGNSIYSDGKLTINASEIAVNDAGYGYVNVEVTFGGGLANIINLIPKMSNPMDLQLRLF